MIGQYDKKFLADFFAYNDPLIEEWATNVYEKIRQNGELANYVERDKYVRDKFDAYNGTIIEPVITNGLFTFGKAYQGNLLTLNGGVTENLGRIFQFEFEIAFSSLPFDNCSFLDDYIIVSSDDTIKVGSIIFSNLGFEAGELYNIKILRQNLEVSLFVNGVLMGTDILDRDEDTEFQVLYEAGGSASRIYNELQYSDFYS